MESLTFFIYSFVSVFTIVNPVSGLVTFISLTEGMDNTERKRTVVRSVVIACTLAIIFAASGDLILRFFGVTVDCLRVAGGILLFVIALNMLQAQTSRESVTMEEIKDAGKRNDVSVFPIAMPVLTGPGAITTVIILIRSGTTIWLKALVLGAVLFTFVLTYIIFSFADKIDKILGVTGSLVLTRIMGLFLASIAVNFVSVGAWNIYMSFTP